MSRRALVLLLGAFVLTRLAGAWLADHPERYGRPTGVNGDVVRYESWARAIVHRHEVPYAGIPIEYPPGVLPFLVAPEIAGGSYRRNLVGLMLAVDAAGLSALLVLARRWGSGLGPWLWVLAVPLLGPIAYVRLDLVPAVATVWAVERISAGSWAGAGAWMGFGALAKLYPGFLLPAGAAAARGRARYLAAASAVGLLGLAPFLPVAGSLLRSVLGYHADRGIQIESTWGLGLLAASRLGHPVRIEYAFGSMNAVAGVAPVLRNLALALTLAAVAAGTWFAARRVPRGAGPGTALAAFGILASVVTTASVFSPQFLLWLVALGAAAVCARGSPARWPVLLLLPAAAASQVIYPFQYHRLVGGEPALLVLLGLRNLLVLAAGVGALRAVRLASRQPSAAPLPEPAGAAR